MKEPRFYIDEKGRTQATLADSEKPEDELCDFCSSKNKPFKVYNCRDFTMSKDPPLTSLGEWNAYSKCASLIDSDSRERLLLRCAFILGAWSEQKYESIRVVHEGFFNHRI